MSGRTSETTESGDCCQPADDCCSVGHSLAAQDLATDVQVLTALGNDTRYEALRLVAGSEDGVCVCELEPGPGVSQGAVSQAVSRLFGAGLVDRRKEGRWRYYTATPRATHILDALDETRDSDGPTGESDDSEACC
jgi:ArsR family transcriptional regulator